MKKIDTRKDELMTIIAGSDDANVIKGAARLFTKMNQLVEEEAKAVALQDKINQLNAEINEALQEFTESTPKVKSNRGRKKKVVA